MTDGSDLVLEEARAHVELLRVLLDTGKLDEADAAFTAARAVVARTADPRATLADGIWPDLNRVRSRQAGSSPRRGGRSPGTDYAVARSWRVWLGVKRRR